MSVNCLRGCECCLSMCEKPISHIFPGNELIKTQPWYSLKHCLSLLTSVLLCLVVIQSSNLLLTSTRDPASKYYTVITSEQLFIQYVIFLIDSFLCIN